MNHLSTCNTCASYIIMGTRPDKTPQTECGCGTFRHALGQDESVMLADHQRRAETKNASSKTGGIRDLLQS